jgi:D-amino-acid dehydrogenase
MTDILIIGGGIIGVTAAYFLAEVGADVTLVEKGDIAAGSSYGNAGLICPCHSEPIPRPGVLTQGLKWLLDPESPFYIKPRLSPDLVAWLWRFQAHCNETAVQRAIPLLRDMQRESLRLYQALIKQEQIDCDFEKKGGLTLFRTEAGLAKGHHEVEAMSRFGLQMELLPDAAAVRALEPSIHPDIAGGIHYQEDAHINPARFVHAMAAAARAKGATLLTDTEVLGFDTGERGITAIRTSQGKHTAQQIVLAAGAWSTPIARQLGLGIPMQPAKGYSVTLPRPANFLHTHLHLAEAKVAVTPMGSLLRLAGTLALAGFDLTINQRRVNAIRRTAGSYLIGLENQEPVEIWRGLRPCPPDGLPYIGRSARHPNLIIATGHAMLGISMGPITGQLVAQLACDQPTTLGLTPFSPDRFA